MTIDYAFTKFIPLFLFLVDSGVFIGCLVWKLVSFFLAVLSFFSHNSEC